MRAVTGRELIERYDLTVLGDHPARAAVLTQVDRVVTVGPITAKPGLRSVKDTGVPMSWSGGGNRNPASAAASRTLLRDEASAPIMLCTSAASLGLSKFHARPLTELETLLIHSPIV